MTTYEALSGTIKCELKLYEERIQILETILANRFTTEVKCIMVKLGITREMAKASLRHCNEMLGFIKEKK